MPQPQENQTENTNALRKIRTFKSDSDEVIEGGQVSLADIYKRQTEQTPFSPEPKTSSSGKKKLFIAGGFFIILAIVVSGIYAYFNLFKNHSPSGQVNQTQEAPTPFLLSQETIIISPGNKNDFKNKLRELLNNVYNAGDMVYIPLKHESSGSFLTTEAFLRLLNTQTSAYLESFLEENFFLGIFNLERNHPVLIFKIKKGGYDSVFTGMLKWEKTIPTDLNFMSIHFSATSTFTDKIIKNQNARVIEENGEGIFVYSIFNRKYIIITDSAKAMEETIKQVVLY